MERYEHDTVIDAPRDVVWDWHTRDGAFERLAPPWEALESVSAPPDLSPGARRVFRFPLGPIKGEWVAEHTELVEGERFVDRMVRGPFAAWLHTHRFVTEGDRTVVRDQVDYAVPMGALGRLVAGAMVRSTVRRMFQAREVRLVRDLAHHGRFADRARRRVLIAGASGLVGSQLVPFLRTGGHEVVQLVRRPPANAWERFWDPAEGVLDPECFDGVDAVIHLGGVGIADRRWSATRKAAIRDSRVDSTRFLAQAMAGLRRKPEVFLVASAIGLYGDRGDAELDESSAPGSGFLPEVVRDWEAAAESARAAGIRTVHLRTGVVVAGTGGALGKMRLPFSLGLGGPIGSGRQWMSWISLDDVLGAVLHLMMTPDTDGAYNLTAPEPVPQRTFARTLGRVLRRPAVAPLPGFVARAVFGELAGPLLLEGQRVLPRRLEASGYRFAHRTLEHALVDTLGLWAPDASPIHDALTAATR